MLKNEKASPPVVQTGGRHAKEYAISPRQLISQLDCIISLGGVQVSSLPYPQRERIYADGIREYADLPRSAVPTDVFWRVWREVCRV